MSYQSVSTILSKEYNLDNDILEENVVVGGWIRTIRRGTKVSFCELNDGSSSKSLQLIINSDEKFTPLSTRGQTGCGLQCKGNIVKSPAKGQLVELIVTELLYFSPHIDERYPIAKAKISLPYLRAKQHLRQRTKTFNSVFRIRSQVLLATHKFFGDINKFSFINPNILTTSDCEGAGEVFTVTELMKINKTSSIPVVKDTDIIDYDKDFANKQMYLTVSSQLQLEAMSLGLGNVYTTNKSFRAEHSSTNKHLCEFEHLEIEWCFRNLNQLMDITEEYIKFICREILDKCNNEVKMLNGFMSKGLIDRLQHIVTNGFIRLTHQEAIDILLADIESGLIKLSSHPSFTKLSEKKQRGIRRKYTVFDNEPKHKEDLATEFENYLTEKFNAPVFVHTWHKGIKPFYMKHIIGTDLVENFDLIMPYGVGELVGGSQREDIYETLVSEMEDKVENKDALDWYVDLRKYGSVPHGGFGCGLDRLVMLCTGMTHVRDVVPFPNAHEFINY